MKNLSTYSLKKKKKKRKSRKKKYIYFVQAIRKSTCGFILYFHLLIYDLFESRYVHKEILLWPEIINPSFLLGLNTTVTQHVQFLQVDCMRLLKLGLFKCLSTISGLWLPSSIKQNTSRTLTSSYKKIFEAREALKMLPLL